MILLAQQAGAQKTPSPFEEVPEAKEQQQQQAPPSPFEEVPEATPEGQRPPSPFEEVPDGEAAPAPIAPRGDIIESIEFRGTRRIPREGLLARIFSKPGDLVDGDVLRRDYMVLWNTGYFDDLRLELEDGEQGKIVRFVATERRVIRSIKYEGLKSATVSDVLERFKERRVGLSVESRYDPTRVQRAVVVLRALLGERGRQYATIQPQVSQIPPSSIEVIFNVDEGPKVKVGKIFIEGNDVVSDQDVRQAMKNLRPMGLPHSLIFEKLFKKTFDIRKLEEDKERVRNMYQERGHFKATVTRHDLSTRDATGRRMFPIPYLFKHGGKRTDVTLHLSEGGEYRLGKLSFTDVELFRDPTILQRVFQMQDGDIFDIKKLREGLDNLKKLYGEFGYIDFVGEPNFEFRDAETPPKVDLNLSVDEGKQFFVRRITFAGNDSTRDKVIRRELLLDEGDMFNTRVWDLSILRLNQLGYFEPLKEEEATDIRRDTRNGLVDLTLNVKERGKNTVSLNGGVSGFAGSFVGFGYATNNFLGLGETLSFDAQLGSRQRALTFGFTEPYLFDRPIQAGFTIFTSRFNFNQGREASIFSGANLIPLFDQLGQDNFLDFRQNTQGFTTFVSYPLRRSFNRLSLTYRFQRDDLKTFSQSAENLFRFQNFLGVSGPNSLEGITTSEITPGFFHNTVNHPITPTGGKSLYASIGLAGLGGNTSFIQPTIETKYFKKVGGRGHVVAMRFMTSILSGYGGKVPPPFRRAYMGGETDIRGFEIFGISPMVWIPDTTTVPIFNDNGTPRTQNLIVEGVETEVPQFTTVPIYRLSFPGGDTRLIYNFEYRIPIFGPVTLAPFFDIGFNKILLSNQVRMNVDRVAELNALFPQAGIEREIQVIPATQKTRASTGLELQVMMPVVQAPFRFYWAYNPMRVESFLQPPIIADRSMFPNRTSFIQAITPFGQPLPFFEKQKIFRFTVSRTF
jgi:outer membrane protein insertion porin family